VSAVNMGFSLDKQVDYRTRTMQHPMFYCSIIYAALQHKSIFSVVFCEIFFRITGPL
jgi:hypothetical protein